MTRRRKARYRARKPVRYRAVEPREGITMGPTIRAAGAVLWREADGDGEVAVIHRPKHDDWTLPKGKLDGDETDLEAACREVQEETGCVVEVGPGLGEIRYRVAGGATEKVVTYWAMRSLDCDFVAGSEVDQLRWLPPAEAMAAVTYERDREVLRRFTELGGGNQQQR